MEGGDNVDYITLDQLLLFGGFVVALIQCIISIINKKK